MTTYLAPALVELGYVGATGSTPYRLSTAQQISTLQNLYANAVNSSRLTSSSAANTVHININFDGTQNNRDYPADGEVMTNIGQIAGLQAGKPGSVRDLNTIYLPGIGAQTEANGSPSNLESTPWRAGEIGNAIVEDAYRRLITRVAQIRASDPTAVIEINLAGFSRGGAQALALANLINEQGIPGLGAAGGVVINSLVLFDPVSQTAGTLNVGWPSNLRNPALVFVAAAENRQWFPLVPLDTSAIIVPLEAVHSDIGGSFNLDGTSAVTLKIARDYLTAVGAPMDDIPAQLLPNWEHMYIHNSAIDNYNNVRFLTIGEPTQTVGVKRYYEGATMGSISIQEMLQRDANIEPIYETRNGIFVLKGFVSKSFDTSTDEATGQTTETQDTVVYARDGKTITAHNTQSITRDDAQKIIARTLVEYDTDGLSVVATHTMQWLPNGNLQTTTYDALGQRVSVAEQQNYLDGSSSELVQYSDGRVVRTNTDATGAVVSVANIQYTGDDGASIETVTYADGRVVQRTYDGVDNLLAEEEIAAGGQTLQNALAQGAATLLDALTLLKAIQSGQPLPLMVSGLRVANDLASAQGASALELSGSANVASGILSLMSLNAALERGDTLGALTAGAQAITFGATAYANFAAGQANLAIALQKGTFGPASGALSTLNTALPYINLVNSIAHGDNTGAAVAAVDLLLINTGVYAVPYLGLAYGVYTMVDSLFGGGKEVPDPWGNGHYVWGAQGVQAQAVGETGGKEAVEGVLNNTLAVLSSLIERQRQSNPGSALGLIANRMPTLGYDMSGYRYTDIDPLSGAQRNAGLRFDTAGRPYNAEVGSADSYRSLLQAVVESALERGAIAPLWEVHTAQLQRAD